MAAGNNTNIADKDVISSMGDSEVFVRRYDKNATGRIWPILTLCTLLIGVGIIIVNTFFSQVDRAWTGFPRLAANIIFGIIVSICIIRMDYRKLNSAAWTGFAIILVLVMLCFSPAGFHFYGVHRLIIFRQFIVYVPDLCVLAVIPISIIMCKLKKRSGVICIFITWGLTALLLLIMGIMPALPQMALIGTTVLILLITAYRRGFFVRFDTFSKAAIFIWVFLGIYTIYIFANMPTFKGIWDSFAFFGANDPFVSGYHTNMTHKWLLNSSVFGSGESLINGRIIEHSLPNPVNEVAWIYFTVRYGLIAGIFVLFAVITVAVNLFKMSLKIKNELGYYMSLASSIVFALKTGVGILICLGLLPIVSIEIPFISYNRFGLLVDMIIVSIVLSAWKHNKEYPAGQQIEEGRLISGAWNLFYGLFNKVLRDET